MAGKPAWAEGGAEPSSIPDSIGQCVRDITRNAERYPLLTHSQVRQLAQRIEIGDEEAKRVLILSNLRLVWSIAKRTAYASSQSVLDLYQEGMEGLIEACERYDPELGYRFSTYAIWWIRKRIYQYVNSVGDSPLRFSADLLQKIRWFEEAEHNLRQSLGRYPTDEEMIKALNQRQRTVRWTKRIVASTRTDRAQQQRILFLDQEWLVDDETYSLHEAIPSSTAEAPAEAVTRQWEEGRKRILRRALTDLPERDQKVLTLRYGLDGSDARTLEEVGLIFGVTRERIRQIEMRSFRRLQPVLEAAGIDPVEFPD